MNKNDIRTRVKARKNLLSEQEKADAAERVFRRLEQSAAFMLADRILMYHSLPDELSTHAFLRKWGKLKHFYLSLIHI